MHPKDSGALISMRIIIIEGEIKRYKDNIVKINVKVFYKNPPGFKHTANGKNK